MRKGLLLFLLIFFIAVPVSGAEFTVPEAPDSARQFLPDETESFGEGLWYVISSALKAMHPNFMDALKTCISLIAAAVIIGLVSDICPDVKKVVSLIGTVSVGVILFQPLHTFIRLGTQTITEISQYGKLLLPVLAAALAAQGAVTQSGSVYMATAFVDALLTTAISDLLVPMVCIYLCVSVCCNLWEQALLQQIQKLLKWLVTWGLKIVLYVFTGYITITGVVAGTTDATILKATKLTISGVVPVVGNILSDASEAVLVSAGMMKNAVGIYGLLAVIALWIGPFVRIGLQYLMLKITGGIVQMFAPKQVAELILDFSSAMGLVLAMTGTVCLLFLISTICFMKGVA